MLTTKENYLGESEMFYFSDGSGLSLFKEQGLTMAFKEMVYLERLWKWLEFQSYFGAPSEEDLTLRECKISFTKPILKNEDVLKTPVSLLSNALYDIEIE